MALLVSQAVELGLDTRRGVKIRNRLDRSLPHAGLQLAIDDHRKNYLSATHRPVGPCNSYNCHGLTFGARRTWIGGTDDIDRVLIEDDYQSVSFGNVLPGDIVIYRKDGKVDHSGIVVERKELTILVLSKWGNLHEVIHALLDCPYNDCQTSFYRVCK